MECLVAGAPPKHVKTANYFNKNILINTLNMLDGVWLFLYVAKIMDETVSIRDCLIMRTLHAILARISFASFFLTCFCLLVVNTELYILTSRPFIYFQH